MSEIDNTPSIEEIADSPIDLEEDVTTDDEAIQLDEDEADEAEADEAADDTDDTDSDESDDDSDESADEATDAVDPKELARQKYLERQAIKARKDDYVSRKETEIADQIAQSGEDETAQRLATVEAKQFLAEVKIARDSLVLDSSRVATIDYFNPNNKELFDQELTDQIMAEYAEANLVLDEDGEIIGVRTPMYEYMQREASKLEKAAKRGAQAGKTAEAKMRSRSTTAPSTGKRTSEKKDAFDIGFDSDTY